MKRKLLLSIFLAGICSTLLAQSYQPIISDEITYFGTADTSLSWR